MINEHDIEDMCPPLTEEDYINDDRAYWIDAEVGPIKMQMGYGRQAPCGRSQWRAGYNVVGYCNPPTRPVSADRQQKEEGIGRKAWQT